MIAWLWFVLGLVVGVLAGFVVGWQLAAKR